ncbi:MAG TPA: hypothetical protein PKC41_13480, partial [Chitinophagaceae bacterium]|nr:hypothetical protein [Chitinophagaceae bacterium]
KSTDAKIKSFYNAVKTKYNIEPWLADANGYDAVMLIVEAINKVGNDPVKVAQYIRNLKNYDGAGGTLNFSDGDVSRENIFKKIVNGKPEIIK